MGRKQYLKRVAEKFFISTEMLSHRLKQFPTNPKHKLKKKKVKMFRLVIVKLLTVKDTK